MSSKFAEIEAAQKKPMQEVITELYQEHGNLRAVAKELGVTQGTVSFWLLKLNLEVRSVIVPRGASVHLQEPAR